MSHGDRSPMSGPSVKNVKNVIRSTSCLVLGWVFLASTDYRPIALFNLTAHELHELYYDKLILLREPLDRLRVRLKFEHVYVSCNNY